MCYTVKTIIKPRFPFVFAHKTEYDEIRLFHKIHKHFYVALHLWKNIKKLRTYYEKIWIFPDEAGKVINIYKKYTAYPMNVRPSCRGESGR